MGFNSGFKGLMLATGLTNPFIERVSKPHEQAHIFLRFIFISLYCLKTALFAFQIAVFEQVSPRNSVRMSSEKSYCAKSAGPKSRH